MAIDTRIIKKFDVESTDTVHLLELAKELAASRGAFRLEYAQRSLDRGSVFQARTFAEEGLRLVQGTFYLPVRDRLMDLLDKIREKLSDPSGS